VPSPTIIIVIRENVGKEAKIIQVQDEMHNEREENTKERNEK
jgi:hypothetical protein